MQLQDKRVATLLVLQTLFFGVKGAASLDRAVGYGVGCPDGMLSPWSWGKEGFVMSWSAVINKWYNHLFGAPLPHTDPFWD